MRKPAPPSPWPAGAARPRPGDPDKGRGLSWKMPNSSALVGPSFPGTNMPPGLRDAVDPARLSPWHHAFGQGGRDGGKGPDRQRKKIPRPGASARGMHMRRLRRPRADDICRLLNRSYTYRNLSGFQQNKGFFVRAIAGTGSVAPHRGRLLPRASPVGLAFLKDHRPRGQIWGSKAVISFAGRSRRPPDFSGSAAGCRFTRPGGEWKSSGSRPKAPSTRISTASSSRPAQSRHRICWGITLTGAGGTGSIPAPGSIPLAT